MSVSMRGATAFTVIFLALAAGWPAAALAADGEISSVGPSPLEVSAKQGEDSTTTHLTLFNPTAKPIRVSLALQGASAGNVSLKGGRPTLPPETAKRVEAIFSGLESLDEEFEGQIVVSGAAAPLTVEVKIAPAPQPSANWPILMIVVSLGVAFAFTLILVLKTGAWGSLSSPAPGPKWSFESWATTLTAAGGIFGTVLGATTYPEFPHEISKATLTNLSVLFVALLVVGPFIFQALRRPQPDPGDQEAGLWGWTATLLIACFITLWAVLGEIGTLGLLCWELCDGGTAGGILIAALALIAVLAIVYFCVTVAKLIKKDWSPEATVAVAVAAVAPAPPAAPSTPHRWSLL